MDDATEHRRLRAVQPIDINHDDEIIHTRRDKNVRMSTTEAYYNFHVRTLTSLSKEYPPAI